MTKWCSLLQLMVPLVVRLCEETERAVRARKYHMYAYPVFVRTLLEIEAGSTINNTVNKLHCMHFSMY